MLNISTYCNLVKSGKFKSDDLSDVLLLNNPYGKSLISYLIS